MIQTTPTRRRAMFKTLWSRRLASQVESKRTLEAECSAIERQVEQFLDRIADTDVPSIVAAYEKRIRDLEERKIVLAERIANCGRALPDFDDALKTPLDFLRNPRNLWDSPRLQDRRAVLKLAFAGRLAYTRKEGFKSPDVSLQRSWRDFGVGHMGNTSGICGRRKCRGRSVPKCRPYRQANRLPFQIETLIVQLKREHPRWGAPKIREKLRRRCSDILLHDQTITVTQCGRLCFGGRKINLSAVFAGHNVGAREVADHVWLISFMHYDLGFFDD